MRHCAAALVVVVLAGALVSAQDPPAGQGRGEGQGRGRAAGPPPPPPKNLQVFPKDWTFQQVVQVMQQFNQALGVQCAHCHVFVAPNDPGNDFASDMKPEKEIARAMVRMVREINPMVQKAVVAKKAAADQVAPVNCMVCHRGSAIPQVPPPPARGGAAGAPTAPGQPTTPPAK